MKHIKNLNLFLLSKYLLDLAPTYINYIVINNLELSVYIKAKNLKSLILLLKNHNNLKFIQLVDLCGVDYIHKKERFELIYNLLSLKYSLRLKIKVKTTELQPIPSLNRVFQSSNWLEREVWDMYGIFFSNHNDLRRILTDYGFEGYPFRKDFPQVGFIEVRYDDKQKHVIYEPVELAQEYRLFKFLSPWVQVK
mgnify:FL=1